MTGGARVRRGLHISNRCTGGLFAVGSICFAVGSLPWYFDSASPVVVAWTFFIGSVFFTTAALLQFLPTWGTRSTDWWASAIQLVGTVWFNVSTFAATRADLSSSQDRRLIWAPDLVGSVCFLVASWIAFSAINRGVRHRPAGRTRDWRIAALNMSGSVAFGAAAIAGRYMRTTGEVANIVLVNLGTCGGALCFLVGALLLATEAEPEPEPAPAHRAQP